MRNSTPCHLTNADALHGEAKHLLAPPSPIWTCRFGELGLFPNPKLTKRYCTQSQLENREPTRGMQPSVTPNRRICIIQFLGQWLQELTKSIYSLKGVSKQKSIVWSFREGCHPGDNIETHGISPKWRPLITLPESVNMP